MATETTIVREAPWLEDQRKKLLASTEKLADVPITLPTQQLAPFSSTTQQAFDAATAGLGAYQPHLTTAGQQLTSAGGQLGGATGITDALAARGPARLDEARLAALAGAGDITGRIGLFKIRTSSRLLMLSPLKLKDKVPLRGNEPPMLQ